MPGDAVIMKSIAYLLLLPALLLAGCNRQQAPEGQGAVPTPPGRLAIEPAGDSERIWVGLLPCSDCQGIDTRLVLRAQGGRHNYLMTETYVGSSGRNSFDRAGSWVEQTRQIEGESVTLYILDPDRGGQSYRLQPDGALELIEGNSGEPGQAVAYRLQRL
jgi:copper homeostasis protein (lipoprotein)